MHHLPLYPYPLSHYLPYPTPMVPLELGLLVHPWNNLIVTIVYASSCSVCILLMLFMLCIGPRAMAVLRNNCVVQVWVYMPHYTESKA